MNRYMMRWLIRRDMPAVMDIEGATPQPLEERDVLEMLRKRDHIGMVAEIGDDVVGYMVYALSGKRLTIQAFGVSPKWRRRGVASAMFEKLKDKLSAHRRTAVVVEVPDTNLYLGLHLALKAAGFRGKCVEGKMIRFAYRLRRPADNLEGGLRGETLLRHG